ncbi:hypothetical protein D7X99_37030 [Corallococcus sp. AB032C]|uniref:hypothetical protein n=1 Tax=Corallococcus TaxID=83461 RepID=UPI000EBEA70B|nr:MULTISPECIES: hypothetical protein [Corallococcus]NPC49625.1 hypothetical protein [Corallococcus exiguus]NPC73197.1 hypothetical protein [Corallococcus exiguus]RKH75803.1 hypothetical protein D7X99_37030 [Corallococcus sp. AB032C]
MDYSNAYFFNLLTFPLALQLNGGAEHVVPPLSDGEPFTARAITWPRTFEASQPKDLFGKQNVLKLGPRGGTSTSANLMVDPEVWPVNQPVQVYLLADLLVLRVGMDGQRVTMPSALVVPSEVSATRRAFFFNMTGQSLGLVLNGGPSVTVPAMPVAEPFTPPLVAFTRVDIAQPSGEAVFGITNVVQYALAGATATPARRKVTLQVKTSDWPLDKDVQVYLFQRSAVVRLGGKATYANATVG